MSKIESIEVKNIKAISHLEVSFKGQTAIITGANNSGKSTLLNALRQRMQSIKVPFTVKQNEEEGSYEIALDTGEQFIWKIKANGNDSMTFISRDGVKGSLTQEIIQKYFAPIFDIDKFLNSTPKDKSLMLQKMVGLDFSKIDAEYNGAYQERALAKRMLETLPVVEVCDPLLPEKIIDLQGLQTEIWGAEKNNHIIHDLKRDYNASNDNISRIKNKIEELENELLLESNNLNLISLKLSESKEVDISQKQKEFTNAIELNKKIEQANKNKSLIEQRTKSAQAVNDAEAKVKEIELRKKEMIVKSNLPKGFTIKNDEIYIDFLPLSKENLSTSQVYIAALKIASLNVKEVKFLTFDASPLDRKNLDEIQAWAIENDLQLLIEKPDYEGGDIRVELVEVKS